MRRLLQTEQSVQRGTLLPLMAARRARRLLHQRQVAMFQCLPSLGLPGAPGGCTNAQEGGAPGGCQARPESTPVPPEAWCSSHSTSRAAGAPGGCTSTQEGNARGAHAVAWTEGYCACGGERATPTPTKTDTTTTPTQQHEHDPTQQQHRHTNMTMRAPNISHNQNNNRTSIQTQLSLQIWFELVQQWAKIMQKGPPGS